MGKHKHRRHDSGYTGQQMNQGYNNGNMGMNPGQMNPGQMNQGQMNMQNQYMQNGMNMNSQGMNNQGQGMNAAMEGAMAQAMGQGMNQGINQGMNNMGMNQNMNPMNMMGNMMNNPLMGLLGGLGGNGGGMPDMSGIIQLLNGFGFGIDPSIANLLGGGMGGNGGNFDMMQMLGSFLGGNSGGNMGGVNQATPQSQGTSTRGTGSPFDDLLTQISPDQMRMIQGILQGLGINGFQQQSTQAPSPTEKKEESLEEILANLDFNSILNNLDNQSFFGMDFTNVNSDSLNDIDVDDVVNGDDYDESIGEVKDADIVEENILSKEKELTQEDYKKLINILIKLIDPNKIRLLQKVFSEYEKKAESK